MKITKDEFIRNIPGYILSLAFGVTASIVTFTYLNAINEQVEPVIIEQPAPIEHTDNNENILIMDDKTGWFSSETFQAEYIVFDDAVFIITQRRYFDKFERKVGSLEEAQDFLEGLY